MERISIKKEFEMRQIFQNNYSALGNVSFRRRASELAKEYSSDTPWIKSGTADSISSPQGENYEQVKKANLPSKEQKKKSPLER
ncbi:MAG TPA: hypothetical protein DF712_16570, partial [Balneola sp.]|nr:hypothetical protein [Balneola sp.]